MHDRLYTDACSLALGILAIVMFSAAFADLLWRGPELHVSTPIERGP